MTILFIVSFVWGTLKLITHLKIFGMSLSFPLSGLIGLSSWRESTIRGLMTLIDIWGFYAMLCYQAYFWFSYFNIIS